MSENILKTWLGDDGKLSYNIFGIDLIFISLSNYYQSIIEILSQKKENYNSNLPNTLNTIEKHVEEVAKQPNNIDIEDFKNSYHNSLLDSQMEMYEELNYAYPQYFRNFFLVQIYSYTESQLKIIGDYLYSKKNIEEKFKSYFDNINNTDENIGILEGYLKYLSEYAGLDLSKIDNEMKILKKAGIIRNIIVHNSGIVRETHKEWTKIQIMATFLKQIQLQKITTKKNNKKKYEIKIPNDILINAVIESSKNLFKKLLEDGLIKVKWN